MNRLFFLTFFSVIVVARGRPEMYTDEYDNVDLDEILSNKRLVDNYMNCIKTGKKCTPEGLKAREVLPEALSTKCSKCSEIQKEKALKVLEWVIQNRPGDFLSIESQFDPEHRYRKEYKNELNERNIVLPELK